MKINPNYKLRDIAGESVVIIQGSLGTDMTKLISLNTTARWLWEKFQDQEFTAEQIAQSLMEEYGIDQQRAHDDAKIWIDAMVKSNAIIL